MSKLDVVEIWKELHRMPEPGMNEFKTGAYLADTFLCSLPALKSSMAGT